MRSKRDTYVRALVTFTVLGLSGLAAAVFVLTNERLASPFSDTYTISAEFSAADGLAGGIGQQVQVVGVNVGQVTGVTIDNGAAVAKLQIRRSRLPAVYADATAALSTVTPLGDLEIELTPGHRGSGPLRHRRITLAQTTAPVPLSDLMSTLDGDTRDYLASLVTSLGQGVGNRGPDLQRMLLALGPTVGQIHSISTALTQRRVQLAQFVHNLARVTQAASDDHTLTQIVAAGDQTLRALGRTALPMRQALQALPATLDVTTRTLEHLGPFANALGPTLSALRPAVRRLPEMLSQLGRFSDLGTRVIDQRVRPLVRHAVPLLRPLSPATSALNNAMPSLIGVAQTTNYLLNELAYVPGGADQGYLKWLDWFGHLLNSMFASGDANGSLLRASVAVECNGLQDVTLLKRVFGHLGVCP